MSNKPSKWDTRLRLLELPGTIKRLHVNQHNLKANAKDGGTRPVVTVQTSAGPVPCTYAKIEGPSELVSYGQLSCGARVWVETTAPVKVENPAYPEHAEEEEAA